MKRYIRAAETQDDFKIMLQQYKHRRDFNNADDSELADLLADLKNKGVAHDVYQHKTGGGCTVFHDDTDPSSIKAATASRMTDFQLEHLFELADDMLYQVYDNYRDEDYTKEDIIQIVIEHVIMVITEMDDDGVYEDLVPFASTKNRQFMKNLEEHVGEMYDTLEW